METKYEVRGGILIVYLSGELDQHLVDKLREQMDRYLLLGHMEHVVFDFTDVDFMDSSGVGMVIGRYRQVQRMGGAVYILHANQAINRILKMSGILKIVKVKESLEEILNELN